MTLTKTYWDYDKQVERCEFCNEIILDDIHECKEDKENYSATLEFGFDLLKMED